jgi:hypothetical protein
MYWGTQTGSLSEWYTNSLSYVQRPVIIEYRSQPHLAHAPISEFVYHSDISCQFVYPDTSRPALHRPSQAKPDDAIHPTIGRPNVHPGQRVTVSYTVRTVRTGIITTHSRRRSGCAERNVRAGGRAGRCVGPVLYSGSKHSYCAGETFEDAVSANAGCSGFRRGGWWK